MDIYNYEPLWISAVKEKKEMVGGRELTDDELKEAIDESNRFCKMMGDLYARAYGNGHLQ